MRPITFLKPVVAGFALMLAASSFVHAKDPIPVVSTFSILGDLVKQVGGNHIALTTLVGHDGDAHVYKPTPADARAVSAAKVLFVNGRTAQKHWKAACVNINDDFKTAKAQQTTHQVSGGNVKTTTTAMPSLVPPAPS